jgi:hypothetical protein
MMAYLRNLCEGFASMLQIRSLVRNPLITNWEWPSRFGMIFATIVIALSTTVSWAQTSNTGALTGTVTDRSGAVVQNAAVAIVSEATGAKRTATTGPDGVYRVPLLPPGLYRIEASTRGFKLAVQSGVPVRVTETTGLDIELEVGSERDSITVEAVPQLVQTDSNTLGRVVDERSVRNLPLVTRNFTQIIGLSPGVSVGLTDATQLGNGNGGTNNYSNDDFSANGGRAYDNNTQMDGVPANDPGGIGYSSGGLAIPSPDSIAEFKVQTGQYDASYGRNAGAAVDLVTKTGSNEFHGGLYEFFRNEALNANSYFFKAAGIPRGILRQNQFGGLIGGPIKKDKLLFFGSYQGTRQLNGVASGCSLTFVGAPLTNDRSAAALGGMFGDQTGVEGGVAVAPDGSNINSIALTFLNLKLADGNYVAPTPKKIVSGAGDYAFSDPCPFQEDQFMTNGDFLHSAKSKFAAKFFSSHQTYTLTLPFLIVPGSGSRATAGYHNLALTHDYVFSSNLLNQAQFGFHRTDVRIDPFQSFTFPQIGTAVIPQSTALAEITIGGTDIIGNFYKSDLATNVYTPQDTLTYIHGRHSLRVGGGVTRTGFTFDFFQGSAISFLSMPDLLLGQSAAQNGSSFSNVFSSIQYPGIQDRHYFNWNPWVYAQDQFKLSPRLTLDLGLRYERPGYPADKNGRNSSFNAALADPNPPVSGSTAGYVVASNFPGTVPAGSVRLNNKWAVNGTGQNTISPRVGFAWQILPTSSRFVLRGGYGIYYSTLLVGEQIIQGAFSAPWSSVGYTQGLANAGATFANPFGQLLSVSDFPRFPAYSPSTQLFLTYPALNSRPAITQQYSLNLQTELANNYLLELGYVGTRGTHLVDGVTLNQAGPASTSHPIRGETTNTLANLPLRVPIQGFQATGLSVVETAGESKYNSLQASVTKRFSHGLQFLASYTFARLFDTESGSTANSGSTGAQVPGDQNNPRSRYGPGSTIRPHRLVISYIYDFPRPFSGGLAGKVLNDWSLSGVTTLQSGHPLTILSLNANNVFGINGYGGDRAEWGPGCNKTKLETPGSVRSKLNNYFNQACIGAYPVIGDDGIGTGFGNMGVGLVNGPGERNFDLALTKRIPVRLFGRESNWEFRSEFFNVFNSPQFADPDTNVADGAAFGVVSSTIANPRVIQFALKYSF